MRDYRKIILIILWVLWVAMVLWAIIYFLVGLFFQQERPPLDISQAWLINYNWTYDHIELKEYWVTFDMRSGWEIIKDSNNYTIKWEFHDIDLEIIPFSIFSLQTNDSLSKYESDTVKYAKKDNIELVGKYKSVYNKKRWDIFITKDNTLIRLIKDSSFKDNNTPMASFEELSWDKVEIYKIFMSYVVKSEDKKLASKYKLTPSDLKKWLEYHKYFQSNKNQEVDYDIIWFWWVYNSIKTEELLEKLIDETKKRFIEKYWIELNKEEIKLYKEEIKKDTNKHFNVVTFARYIVKNNNIYKFTYNTRWGYIEFKSIFEWNFDEFYFKNIEIYEPSFVKWWHQYKWNNIQFIVPYEFSLKDNSSKDKLELSPNVKRYNRWWILFKNTRKSSRSEQIDDVYKNQVKKYITESLSIANETITDVKLIKSNNLELGWFNWIWNVFKFETVNKDDFIFIEYILFDKTNYYTIGFHYWEDEKWLVESFEELINSVNKIK